MTSGMNTIMYPVKDLDAAKRLYSTLLGVEPYMDQPYYVGFNVAAKTSASTRTATTRA